MRTSFILIFFILSSFSVALAATPKEQRLKNKIAKLQSQIVQMRQNHKSKKAEIRTRLRGKIAELREKNKNLRSENRALKKLSKEERALKAKVEQLTGDLQTAQESNLTLQSDLNAANGQISTLINDIQALGGENANLQADLDQQILANAQIQSQLNTANSNIQSLELDLAQTNLLVSELRNQIDAKNSENENLSRQKFALAQKVDIKDERIKILTKDLVPQFNLIAEPLLCKNGAEVVISGLDFNFNGRLEPGELENPIEVSCELADIEFNDEEFSEDFSQLRLIVFASDLPLEQKEALFQNLQEYFQGVLVALNGLEPGSNELRNEKLKAESQLNEVLVRIEQAVQSEQAQADQLFGDIFAHVGGILTAILDSIGEIPTDSTNI